MFPKPTRYRKPQKIINPQHWTRNSWDEIGWIKHTRFRKKHFFKLLESLDIPEGIITANRYRCDGETALAMMLYRIHYPSRLCDMREIFNGWSEAMISSINNHMIDLFYEKFHHLLRFRGQDWTKKKMKRWERKIRKKGPCDHVMAFMDATSTDPLAYSSYLC